MTYTSTYFNEAKQIIDQLDQKVIEKMVILLRQVRDRDGRLFIVGVGGGAGHASHAVNDFRKIAQIESYSPADNVSELTARTNDEGWETTYSAWLKVSKFNAKDALLVFSVGGGDLERNISPNLVRSVQLAKEVGATVLGVVGRDGGYTAKVADACVVVPPINPASVTPHTEAFQAVVWHLVVSHPDLQAMPNKWERSV